MSENILVINHTAPFDGAHIREGLDMALIFAALDQNISWLFKGPAVLALKQGNNASTLGIKNYFKQLKTLEIYDVEQVYVCAEAMKRFALTPDDLNIDAQLLSVDEQQVLLSQQSKVVSL
ncbi:sulfurtransferase complex subunit TusC [Pseudoalteromonas rubra]|uniref:Sulfurtransferase complex subunit TusC n=1 Tax=Pseudoalteromonas rubra TaxID=43658 RepID=A0A5S3WHI5_9GAMM|nr:sulfurtransferase complex subunit TusC [Pseudoalteromonas rubra]TMP25795.1 sulfurtransferase complex subunit TusC [Pseudoalteromonas rubra]TMP34981.1 sulfurtransferase complex subunit TusC [Pseudoalteromonas rubra]